GSLLVGIPPGADLQPAANPAQAFAGVRSAGRSTNDALGRHTILVRIESLFRSFENLLVDDGLCRQRGFPFHYCYLSMAAGGSKIRPNFGQRVPLAMPRAA